MTPAIVMQHHDPHAMPPAPPPPPRSSGGPLPTGRHPLALQGKIHAIRTAYSFMAIAMLLAGDILCQTPVPEHGWLLFGLAVYPHIGHLLFGRFDIRRLRGRTMFFVDGLIAGAVIAAFGVFAPPAAIIGIIHLFNWMVVGGPALVFTGTLAMLAGFFGMATDGSLANPIAAACTVPDWLTSLTLLAYLLIVAGVIHRLVMELGQHQMELQAETDAALHAKALAEGALLATLPPGTAQRFADSGFIAPEDIDDASLLLLRFEIEAFGTPSLESMTEYLNASDPILSRHGFELFKTFGHKALAISRAATGPNDGVAAVREIFAYFTNHAPGNPSVSTDPGIRAALCCGTIRTGLVQKERLNLDLTGEAANMLESLATVLDADTGGRLVICPAARQRLPEDAGFVFIPGDGRLPPHFCPADRGATS